MEIRIREILVGAVTAIVTWLLLSYVFFPIKLSAPANEYFVATVTHMMPLKSVITIIFVLTSIFFYEQRVKKGKKK